MNKAEAVDVEVVGDGSLVRLHLCTDKARDWVDAFVDAAPYMWLGDNVFCAEPRYAVDIVNAMQENGMVVK
jgi:hypothetical protein